MMTHTTTQKHEPLPSETRVLNVQNGEPGTILNGFAYEPARGWVEYEVVTQYGIERWRRGDFVPFSELDTDN